MTNPFQHVKRKQFTPQQRARIFAERGGICGWVNAGKSEGCRRKLRPGDSWRLEHGDALEKGGNNDEENIGISCEWCWPAKDAEDHADAGHFRRGYTRHVVPAEYRRSKSWGRR